MKFFPILFLIAFAFAQEQKSEADKRAELLGTINVSRIHSLDEVKGSYKSPRKAMFMSLIVPGSGQFYVGGQARYIRGAFYLAEEIALLTGLYYHSVYKYDNQVKKYQRFADAHFSIREYEEAMAGITVFDGDREAFQINYGSERENYCKAIYGPAWGSSNECVSFETGLKFYETTYPEVKSFYDPAMFYRTIASEYFVLGWDDIPPDNNPEAAIEKGGKLANSQNLNEYIALRKRATDLADRQAIFFGAIILNHIVSAIDAALSAKAHNNRLYEEKISFMDKIRLNSNFTAGENFRAETAVVYVF